MSFVPGKSGNPKGRPAGVPNKATATAREAFQLAFDKLGGPEQLATWANENQTEFYKLYGRLIPVDITAKADLSGKLEVTWKPAE